jgi:hypothetical protein
LRIFEHLDQQIGADIARTDDRYLGLRAHAGVP